MSALSSVDLAFRTDGEPHDAAVTKADIVALEARLRRLFLGFALYVAALSLAVGGTVVGFIVAAHGQSREDFRAFQEAAAEDRRAMQSFIRVLTDRTARTEEGLGARIPVQTLMPRGE